MNKNKRNNKKKEKNNHDEKKDESIYLRDFERISNVEVLTDSIPRLKRIYGEMYRCWNAEVAEYEKLMPNPHLRHGSQQEQQIPKRNYPNSLGTVEIGNLFPYHSACYPLLDAYDWLEEEEEEEGENSTEPNDNNGIVPPSHTSLAERRAVENGVHEVQRGACFLHTSFEACRRSLLFSHESTQFDGLVFLNPLLPPIDGDEEEEEDDEQINILRKWWLSRHGHAGNLWNLLDNNKNDENKKKNDNTDMNDEENEESSPYGPSQFPQTNSARHLLLLRLLKHSLSTLQQDHYLASLIVIRMVDWKVFDNVTTFQTFLCILMAERRKCVGVCWLDLLDRQDNNNNNENDIEIDEEEEEMDHICRLYQRFESILTNFSWGMTYFTSLHAQAVCAAVKMAIDLVSGPAGKVEDDIIRNGLPANTSNKAKLLENIYLWNQSEDDDDFDDEDDDGEGAAMRRRHRRRSDPMPYGILSAFVVGLGARAEADRFKIGKLKKHLEKANANGSDKKEPLLLEVLENLIDSFHNSVRTLVFISEIVVRRFSMNQDSNDLGGFLVNALLRAMLPTDDTDKDGETAIDTINSDEFIDEPTPFSRGDPLAMLSSRLAQAGQAGRGTYFANEHQAKCHKRGKSSRLRSLIDPDRYADAIATATRRHQLCCEFQDARPFSSRGSWSLDDGLRECNAFLHSLPDREVLDAVRCLFARDLVDIEVSGCGFGDFMVWTGVVPCANDPFYFFHNHNYPFEDFETRDENFHWVLDEDGNTFNTRRFEARYDFAILKLMMEWHKPWKKESHYSFQPPFRQAIQTLLKCTHRLGLPSEIALTVAEFLPRSWWRDRRARCWCDECSVENALLLLRWKLANKNESGPAPHATPMPRLSANYACPRCHVAMYRNKTHCKDDVMGGHGRDCLRPPYCIPGPKERALCRVVDSINDNKNNVNYSNHTYGNSSKGDTLLSSNLDILDSGNDDDSWESLSSNEDDNVSPTTMNEVIYRFFKNNTYKLQETTDSPFVQMYFRDE